MEGEKAALFGAAVPKEGVLVREKNGDSIAGGGAVVVVFSSGKEKSSPKDESNVARDEGDGIELSSIPRGNGGKWLSPPSLITGNDAAR